MTLQAKSPLLDNVIFYFDSVASRFQQRFSVAER